MHPVDVHADRRGKYVQHMGKYDFSSLPFPVPLRVVGYFALRNNKSNNVGGVDDDNEVIYPLRVLSTLVPDRDAGLSKQQISNVFANQETLRVANIPPLTAIDTFSDARNGKIKAEFYDGCQNIPDPSALDPIQNNLLLLDDCFLGKQNNAEAYYTRGRHNCDTIYIAQNYFHLPRHRVGENSNFIILFPQDVKNLTHIHADHCASDTFLSEFKQFCHGVWSWGAGHNFVTIDLTSPPMNGKYRQNFNRFYFPVNCM